MVVSCARARKPLGWVLGGSIAPLLVALIGPVVPPAVAADLPIEMRPSVDPFYRWDGGYVGGNLGYGRATSNFGLVGFPDGGFTGLIPPIPTTTSTSANGFVGGLQFGWQRQIDALVVGFEQDLMAGSLGTTANSSGTAGGFPFAMKQQQNLDWLATLRGRIGFAPNDKFMLYASGGLAFGEVTTSSNLALGNATFSDTSRDFRAGWAAGGGVEYAITNELSTRLEYLHFDLGHTTLVGVPNFSGVFETDTDASLRGDIVRAGIDYRLGEGRPFLADGLVPFRSFESEIGVRYWYSTGSTTKNLYGISGSSMVSRLTYSGLTASSGEGFARLDHYSGVFVKGVAAAGVIGAGSLKDEDFPPGISPYSATNSAQRDGTLSYFSGDVGYNLLQRPTYRLGAFAGIFFEREVDNAHGCAQTATNPNVCSPAISDPILGITENARWTAARIGLNGQATLWNRVRLDADAAWLPYVMLDSTDTHWLRIQPIAGNFAGPVPEDGVGYNGVQLEGILSYLITPTFSVGVGARYWRMETDGNAHFENDIVGFLGAPQPVHFVTERYGGFLQSAFKF